MRLLHTAGAVRASFDDPNVVSYAGLVAVMRLAETAGLQRVVAEKVRGLPPSVGANPAGKVAAIVVGMVAGGDCIDDLDVVRHGGVAALFAGVYAPSTLGSLRVASLTGTGCSCSPPPASCWSGCPHAARLA